MQNKENQNKKPNKGIKQHRKSLKKKENLWNYQSILLSAVNS